MAVAVESSTIVPPTGIPDTGPVNPPAQRESLATRVAQILQRGGDAPALAERDREVVGDPETGETSLKLFPSFRTLSFKDVWQQVRDVAYDLYYDADASLRPRVPIAFLGFCGIDYSVLEFAGHLLGAVIAPLQIDAPLSTLDPLIAELEPLIITVSIEQVDKAVELAANNKMVKRVIVFSYNADLSLERSIFDAAQAKLTARGVSAKLDSLDDIRQRRKDSPVPPLDMPEKGTDPLHLLVYTSGSTGTPKGAMITQRIMLRMWSLDWSQHNGGEVTLCYYPMNHILGQSSVAGSLVSGGICCFTAKSDMSTILEDLALVRPTKFTIVPRVGEMIYQWYLDEYSQRLKNGADPKTLESDLKIELRDKVMGGRIKSALVAGAKLKENITAFMAEVLGTFIEFGYGGTETGVVCARTKVQRPPVIDWKLEDVPEMGYYTSDKPYPRGQFLLKSESVVAGYFKRPDLNSKVFTEDGYYISGDILAQVGPDELIFLDRTNNVLKLSQGEFVATQRLEYIFADKIPEIRQIYIDGESDQAYLVGVIVPSKEALEEFGSNLDELRVILHQKLKDVAKEEGLLPYEIPRDFIIETTAFSYNNGLLSNLLKNLYPKLKIKYRDQMRALYDSLAAKQHEELQLLQSSADNLPTLEIVCKAAQLVLGDTSTDVDPDSLFSENGGDSISSHTFSKRLQSLFSIDIPLSVIANPANSFRNIADFVDRAKAQAKDKSLFEVLHGKNPTVAKATDFTLDKFIDADVLAKASQAPFVTGPIKTVLLTGSTGFLGRFNCLKWLEHLAPIGGKVICIVRGKNNADARQRLVTAIDTGDKALLEHFNQLARDHLEVLAGDLGQTHLGLDSETWQRLADSVDLIFHSGALVNHVLPYSELFHPNVIGTANLIQLAITTRRKRFVYVSTLAVVGREDKLDENADVRVAIPEVPIDQSHANGYRVSKWGGEVLLRNAHDAFGLASTVFRSDMILADRKYAGQINVPDMFTRLLISLISTGIVPASFYPIGPGGQPQRTVYGGIPVDYLAQVTNGIALARESGYQTYHARNQEAGGGSLDTVTEGLEQSDIKIQRIPDYDDWFTRFSAGNRALPNGVRQRSFLPLLRSFAKQNHGIQPQSTDEFRKAIQNAPECPEKTIPGITLDIVKKYVSDINHLQLLQ
ncbi:hypothetical protein AYO20_07068 [Fonsecaea nubica]|uniref:Carrier domain-containing protein n=1 Tax=Fonsecaea nubica TaxID=856822 RepID=A0A178CV43_9EURO|nr:hypothetical protein AYO20_07068 [Fonsecaea nubica]OAL33730.1 hypothetical protein AYO20_07068 [Fonsecaea nubica]